MVKHLSFSMPFNIRYIFSFSFFFLVLSTGYTQNLQSKIDDLAAKEDMQGAGISFYAIDTKSNKVLASYDKDRLLTPASTMKLITTSAALQLFESTHRFKTVISYEGSIDKQTKILYGNIYILGGGDPTLGADYFSSTYGDFMHNWVLAIKKAGIDSITGSIIGDASYFDDNLVPDGWIWGDIGNYYGAGPNGLSIYDNSYTIHFSSGTQAGDSTSVLFTDPVIPGLTFFNRVQASNRNSDNCYVYGAPYSYVRILEGTIPKNRSDYHETKGSIPEPALMAAQHLEMALKKEGVGVQKKATTVRMSGRKTSSNQPVQIFSTNSPQLKDIVTRTNEKSVNLYAETLLIHNGIKLGSPANTEDAADALASYWSGKIPTFKNAVLSDGSGLSRKNAVTAEQLASVVNYTLKTSAGTDFANSLAIAGKTGTLASMCRGGAGNGRVHAKSGSMANVRSYAGYVNSTSGKKIAFAIIVNNYSCSGSTIKNRIADIMNSLAVQ